LKITSVDIFDISTAKSSNPDAFPKFAPIILRVNTDEGISGFGEVGLAYGTARDAARGIVADLALYVIGEDPLRIEYIYDKLFKKTFWGSGGGPVIYGGMSGIDIALWDIKGKAFNLPVWQMLGGKTRDKVRAYASQIQFNWGAERRNMRTPQEYAEAAGRAVAEGFTCVKVDPVGFNKDTEWDKDDLTFINKEQLDLFVSRVAAIREAHGPGLEIIIELHSFLSPASAAQFINAVEAFNIKFVEEPFHGMNPECYKFLSGKIKTPLAAGERLYTRYGYRPYIESGLLQVIQPDLGLVGGITEGKKICDYAAVYGVGVQAHVCGGPIATAAALQLEAAIPNFIIHEQHKVATIQSNIDLCVYDYLATDGCLPIPSLPGIGQELTEKAMREAKIRTITR
jgi:L-alanine-DL-glutamate epimerase-like enolase superfamily enzyme